MRIVAPAVLAVLFLVAMWGCQVDYHAAPPVPYDRAPLTEAERQEFNQLKAEARRDPKTVGRHPCRIGRRGRAPERRGGCGPGDERAERRRAPAVSRNSATGWRLSRRKSRTSGSSCRCARKSCGCCGMRYSRRTSRRARRRSRLRRPRARKHRRRTARRSRSHHPRRRRLRRWLNRTTRTHGKRLREKGLSRRHPAVQEIRRGPSEQPA